MGTAHAKGAGSLPKQGQAAPAPATSARETAAQTAERAQVVMGAMRAELADVERVAEATTAKVIRALDATTRLTMSARGLSVALRTLDDDLHNFSRAGWGVASGPPPARPRSGPGVVAPVLFVLGALLLLGWLWFGPDPAARFSDVDRPVRARRLAPPAPADLVPLPERVAPPLPPDPLPPPRVIPPPAAPPDLVPGPPPATPMPRPRRDADA